MVGDVVLICGREGRSLRGRRWELERIATRLAPEGLRPAAPLITETNRVAVAIVNPSPEGVVVEDGAVCLGGMFGIDHRWSRVGSVAPDGTYAMARYDAGSFELLSDVAASRPLWWTLTDEALLASTSQRALAALLGGLRLNPATAAWLLSSGTTGPESAWDERVQLLPPDARLVLHRAAWRLEVTRQPAAFTAARRDAKAHVAALRDAIGATCAELGLDLTRWRLPLSGGLDSRVILAGMADNGLKPRCVTWTTRASLRDPLSDARIARLVARHFHAEHDYLYLEDPEEGSIGRTLDRFVSASEGRSDAFVGYADGSEVWRRLVAVGVSGIIRGDESAGERKRDAHDEGSRRGAGAIMVEDYDQTHVIRRLGLAAQEWPAWLERQEAESPEQYCDRMSQQLYVPMVLGPLNAIKGRYVEVVNPLLSRRVIGVVRELPDALRMYGRALHRVASTACPWIPYARNPSLPDARHLASPHDFAEIFVRELTSPDMARVLREEGTTELLVSLAASARSSPTLRRGMFAALKAASIVLPARAYDRLAPRYDLPDELTAATLALRATIASKTIALLEQDADLLRESAPSMSND